MMNDICREHYNNLRDYATEKQLKYKSKETIFNLDLYKKAQNNLYYYVLALYDAGIITKEQYNEMIL